LDVRLKEPYRALAQEHAHYLLETLASSSNLPNI
jgi:hypothetical protein